MPATLPRANGINPVVIGPRLWNALCDMVEGAAKCSAVSPIQIEDLGAGGKIFSAPGVPSIRLLKTTTPVSSQAGRFNAKTYRLTVKANASGNLAEADLGTVASSDDRIVWDLDAVPNARLGLEIGYDGTSNKAVVLLAPRGEIPVTLAWDTTGADGTTSAAPTWKYNATDLGGNTIASGISPAQNRPKGKTTKATRGTLIVVSGAYVLHWCDECAAFGPCPAP